MHTRSFLYYPDAEAYALKMGDKLDAHSFIGQHRISGLFIVSFIEV